MKPEEVYLAALCLLARYRGKSTSLHPERCAWCLRPTEELEAICAAPVDNATWAKLSHRERMERLDQTREEAQIASFDALDL